MILNYHECMFWRACRNLIALSVYLFALVVLPSVVEGKETPQSQIEILGEVTKRSELPEPSTAAYPNCLTFLKFKVIKVIKGNFSTGEALVAMWGFQDYKLSEPGGLKVGDVVKLQLVPYKEVESELSEIMRVDDTQDYDSELYWAPAWEIKSGKEKDLSKITAPTAKAGKKPRPDIRGKINRILQAHDGDVIGGPDAQMLFGHYSYLITPRFWDAPRDGKIVRQTTVIQAITDFAQYLKKKNIQLVMLFPPAKTAVYPELAANIDYDIERDGRIDTYFLEFLEQLKKNEIFYVDILPEFSHNKWTKGPDNNRYPLYLQDDVHWSDVAASLAGKAVSRAVKESAWFNEIEHELKPHKVSYKENLEIRQNPPGLYSRDNPDWRYPTPDSVLRIITPAPGNEFIMGKNAPKSPVWILGDSYLQNDDFYQDVSAGLGVPCYVLAILGGSPTGPREAFARLQDTSHIKIVIWEITSGYLAFPSMWKTVEFNKHKIYPLTEKLSQAKLSHKNVTVAEVSLYEIKRNAFSIELPQDASGKFVAASMVWAGVNLGQNPIISTAIGSKAVSTDTVCGIEHEIIVNDQVVATRKVEQSKSDDRYKNAWMWSNKWDVDLGKYANQTVTLELKAVPASCWKGGELFWGDTLVEDAK